MIISHSKPFIDKEDIESVSNVLASGFIAQGEKVKEFEKKIAKFVGVKYSIAVSSGTAAIHLALLGLNIGAGDEVIVPSFVCTSPYMALLHAGCKPIILDINLSDYSLSLKAIKKALTPNTKAIIVPHMFGIPAEIDEIMEFGVPIIEDCAQSLGAEYKKSRVGSFGDASICSFYATKMITTGEGGMVLTNKNESYEDIKEIREYDKKSLNKIRYNYKMTDIQAALGISQLKKIKNFIERRREIAHLYNESFSKLDINLPQLFSHKKPVFYRYIIILKELDKFQKAVKERGIICEKPVWEPLHKYFTDIYCPNSDYVFKNALSIPLYPRLTQKEISYVIRNIEEIFNLKG